MGRFPFPMPFGWFKVAMPPEIPVGSIVSRHYFDTELVLWRGEDNRVVCQEAYCPHLGAHLGVGGSVEGSCVRCPFHGWVFDASGSIVEIPYAPKPNRKAAVRTFPTREHAGVVFAWYHPDGMDPMWDLMDVPEYDDPEYSDYEVYDFTVKTCIQEMAENGFDHAHFQYVHNHPRVGHTEKVEFEGYDRTVLTSQEFPSSRGPVDARIDVFGRGPGVAVTRYRGLIDASLFGCSTPVDEETTQLTFLFTLKNPDSDEHIGRIAEAFVRSVTSEVQQDIPIWEHKRFNARPALAASEKPILDFRRWMGQFYVNVDGHSE
ncbi:MAG TPA: Rieske 2Fe-2S domain-containing protein [Acidimicrobiales bacterium]|nr:Rieske 2Fe-2S domain-containing protein [Acidimicrobiales bacterium]